jgi:hypothetical protein
MQYNICLDLGTSGVKLGCSRGDVIFTQSSFPAYFYATEEKFVGLDKWTVKDHTKYNGLVGESVQDFNPNPITRSSEIYDSDEYMLGILFSVAKCLDDEDACEHAVISLLLALPAAHLSKINVIRQKLEGSHTIRREGVLRSVMFKSVDAISQGEAVVWSAGFRWEGKSLSDAGFKRLMPMGKMIVGVFGTNSVEWSCFAGNLKDLQSRSVIFGLLEMLDDLAGYTYAATGKNLNQAQLLKVMREGEYSFKGITYNFRNVLSELTERYLSQPKFKTDIAKYLATVGFDADDRGSVVLAGGVLLHNASPIYELFDGLSQTVEMALDEDANPESVRFAVLDGLQKHQTYLLSRKPC